MAPTYKGDEATTGQVVKPWPPKTSRTISLKAWNILIEYHSCKEFYSNDAIRMLFHPQSYMDIITHPCPKFNGHLTKG